MKPTDAERAYAQLKRKIIQAQMPPGSVISEAQLMDEFSLGRTPIREAIKQLQMEDLVMVTPRKGMFVADIAVTDLLQIFEVRIELEAFATVLAVQRITEVEIKKLEKLVLAFQKADHSDKDYLINLDKEFHSMIAKATHNKFLIKELEYYYSLSLRIWHIALTYASPDEIDVVAHIGQRMRKHIQDFHKTIKHYI